MSIQLKQKVNDDGISLMHPQDETTPLVTLHNPAIARTVSHAIEVRDPRSRAEAQMVLGSLPNHLFIDPAQRYEISYAVITSTGADATLIWDYKGNQIRCQRSANSQESKQYAIHEAERLTENQPHAFASVHISLKDRDSCNHLNRIGFAMTGNYLEQALQNMSIRNKVPPAPGEDRYLWFTIDAWRITDDLIRITPSLQTPEGESANDNSIPSIGLTQQEFNQVAYGKYRETFHTTLYWLCRAALPNREGANP